jgi:hypothetical protein
MATKKARLKTAGPQILKDLGLTDEELLAFLPPEAPKWLRGVLWCSFESPLTLDEIAAHFAPRYAVKFIDNMDPPDPVNGHRILLVRPKGRYVTYSFEGASTPYAEKSPWRLEAGFRESGTEWGSNRAVYERFKALELPGLKATQVQELTV